MRYALRAVLGALFCASAISKLSAIESFDLYIFSFQLFPFDLCSLIARLLIVSELLLGLGLISGFWRKALNWLCAFVLVAFSAFLAWRWAIGDSESCHCFGDVLDMNPWQSLVKNAVLGLLLTFAWKSPQSDAAQLLERLLPKFKSRIVRPLAAILISLAASVTVFAICPTSSFFRSRKSSINLDVERWKPLSDEYATSQGRHVVLFLSPLCEHCQHCALKINTIVERHSLDTSKMHAIFTTVTDRPSDMDKLIPYFYEQAGIEAFDFDTRVITYDLFLPMTDGVMPLVCLFEDGELIAEYSYNTLDETALADFLSL